MMQVTETLNAGLKREIQVVVPAQDMEARLMERLNDAKGKVRINGFRPGKVPMQHLRKMYGKSMMAEVVNDILSKSTSSILSERGEKAAMQPEVKMTEDEKEAEKILAGQADFEFSIAYEIIPAIEIQDVSGIAITREVYDVPEAEIDEQAMRIAESARTYTAKDGAAESGDRVTMDYVGKVDGEAFEGGTDTGANLVLGSGQFIPGFEDQLIGVKAGDEKTIEVTFPTEYQAAHLAGKAATFDVKVTEVAKAEPIELNDDLARNLGLESVERLREIIKGQLENQFGSVTRQKVKRQLLDALDTAYTFEAPTRLVQAEFNNIWLQVTRDLEQAGKSFADEDTTEDEARAEYQRLAERRVRLGLVLAEIGEKAGVQVSDEEMQRALFDFVRRYPGQEQEVYDFYRKNPNALAELRAPIFEEKVVDHLLAQTSVTDKKVTKEELLADDEAEKAEAAEAAEAEPKKEAAPKKAAPRKKAAKAEDAETGEGAE
jgi:trigger factor